MPDDSTELANHARLAEQVEQLQAQLASAQAERTEVVSQRDRAEKQIVEAEARLARTEGRAQRLEADLAVDEARRADREQRLAAVDQLVTAAGDERAQATAALDAARTRQADVAAARQTAAAELETAQTALREASQQVDRLEGALQALGATHLRHENGEVDLPDAWREMLTDLPVLGLAGDLAPRVLQIDRLLRGYLRRAVVLRDDAAAREAHRRLGESLPDGRARLGGALAGWPAAYAGRCPPGRDRHRRGHRAGRLGSPGSGARIRAEPAGGGQTIS